MPKEADFIGVKFSCEEEFTEIIIAELGGLGYNSMMETEVGVDGYIKKENFKKEDIQDILKKYSQTKISVEIEELENKNWNEEWEKNYDPIIIDNRCFVRATFHQPDPSFPYEIVITPKMSFGTGHHATTYLMLKVQMQLNHKGKRVLDAGCGTAILSIMASKLGAGEVIGYDIDSWSTENAQENVAINNCHNIEIMEGTINTIELTGKFDIIVANINKNILLDELEAYSNYLSENAILILSGFYTYDSSDLIEKAANYNLELEAEANKDEWAVLTFVKK